MKELEKMDILRKRMNVSYSQAKEALDQSDGDLVEALIYLEKEGFSRTDGRDVYGDDDVREPKWDKEKTENFVRGLIEQIKSIIQEGNVTKVRLISGDKVLLELPATVSVVGLGLVLFSPLLIAITAIGAVAAVIKEMVLEVEKSDGSIERRSLKFPGFSWKKDDAGEGAGCCDDDSECCKDDKEENGGDQIWGDGDK